jgi:hypothetical protein
MPDYQCITEDKIKNKSKQKGAIFDEIAPFCL